MSARSHEATVPLLTVDDEEPELNIQKADKYDPAGEEGHDHYIRSRNKKQTGSSKLLMVVAIGVIMAFIFVNVYYVVPMIQKWAASGRNHTGVDLQLQSGDSTVNMNPTVLEKNKPCLICLYGEDNVPGSLSPQQLQLKFRNIPLSQICNTECEQLMYTLPPDSSQPTSDQGMESDEDTNTGDLSDDDYDYSSEVDYSQFYDVGSGLDGDYENMEADGGVEDWLGPETDVDSSSAEEGDKGHESAKNLAASKEEKEDEEVIAAPKTKDIKDGGEVDSAESGTDTDDEIIYSSEEEYDTGSDYVDYWLNGDSDENEDDKRVEVNDDAYTENDTENENY